MSENRDRSPTSPGMKLRASPRSIYKVPRRFDLATMFVVTFAFAALLSVLGRFDAPVAFQVWLVSLLTLVGFVQMFVPVRYVRWASVACGWIMFAIALTTIQMQNRDSMIFGEIITGLCCGVLLSGSLFGYLAGVVVAGVFLVADYVRKGGISALGRED